ncbi:MAG: Holliday junction resolvase RuvX [Candidatus Riflebacteria bacterium]|nr:Holliday junction resolvase RuvX [Candidatus Riflebacteria bacterium]
MRIIALDVGTVRIGVAACDKLEIAASPHSVVRASGKPWKEIAKIAKQLEAELIVIGLPVSLDGQEKTSCVKIREFAEELKKHTKVPIEFFDEKFTSRIAEASLIEGGMRREKRKDVIDAVAASLILQGYIAYKNNKGQTQ